MNEITQINPSTSETSYLLDWFDPSLPFARVRVFRSNHLLAPAQEDLFIGIHKYESGFERILGWVMYLFDHAIKVIEAGRNYYVSTGDLAKRLCPNLPENSKHIYRVMLEILNPINGEPVAAEKIQELIRQSPLQNLSPEKLDSLRTGHLDQLAFDPEELEARLKPGDLIFKKMPDDTNHLVVWGQKTFNWIIPKPKEREGYKFSHVAIYIGNGQIAEAVPEKEGCEVRILSIRDRRFALNKESHYRYLIARPVDERLGVEAASIARKVATPARDEEQIVTDHKYNKLYAAVSAILPSFFGPFARYRYVRNYDDMHKNKAPQDYFGSKQFFCSYFGGYCYQVAESLRVMPKIMGETASPDIPVPIVNQMTRSAWSRITRIVHWCEMSREIKLKFDAKRLSPQDFRNFIIRNPDQFKDQMFIR